MATKTPEKKSDLSSLAQEIKQVEATNDRDWKAAEQLGITKQQLDRDHPELAQAESEFKKAGSKFVRNGAILTGGSAIVAGAVPLVTKWPKNGWGRAAVTLAAAGTAAVAAVVATFTLLSRPFARKSNEFTKLENKALEQEIGAAVAIEASQQPDSKGFAASISPRAVNHVTQIADEVAQKTHAMLGS